MAKITAFIHAHAAADALRLSRALDAFRVCDQVLIINHSGSDEVARIAREHGAQTKAAIPGVSPGAYLMDAEHDWILCLRPAEALSEALEASLFQWKQSDHEAGTGFSAGVREETINGWQHLPPETRLVNRNTINWTGDLPGNNPDAELLAGDILRFTLP